MTVTVVDLARVAVVITYVAQVVGVLGVVVALAVAGVGTPRFDVERVAVVRRLGVMLVGLALCCATVAGLTAVIVGPARVPWLGAWSIAGAPTLAALVGVGVMVGTRNRPGKG